MNNHDTWLLSIKNSMHYLPETLALIKSQSYKNWDVLAQNNDLTNGFLKVRVT